MSVLKSIFSIFTKKNQEEEGNNDSNIVEEDAETKAMYDYIYSNVVLDDFAQLAKDNVLNVNYENYCYNELSFDSIMKVIKNQNIANLDTNSSVLTISYGAGQLPIILKKYYHFAVVYGVETTFEFFNLSKQFLEQYIEYNDFNVSKIPLTMNDPLLIDFSKFNLIFIEYSNTNILYNDMLKEKIKQECKSNTVIVKFATRFKADEIIKLVDKISIENKNNENNFVYFYRVK